jgi:endo-1,4-beta-D-glucanase Y
VIELLEQGCTLEQIKRTLAQEAAEPQQAPTSELPIAGFRAVFSRHNQRQRLVTAIEADVIPARNLEIKYPNGITAFYAQKGTPPRSEGQGGSCEKPHVTINS